MGFREVTMEERMRMVGQTVTPEDEAFYEAWRRYNRAADLRANDTVVSVVDERLPLMRFMFDYGVAFGSKNTSED